MTPMLFNLQPRKFPQLAHTIRSIPGALLMLLALFEISPRAEAAVKTWNGSSDGGRSTNWANTTNQSGTAPLNCDSSTIACDSSTFD